MSDSYQIVTERTPAQRGGRQRRVPALRQPPGLAFKSFRQIAHRMSLCRKGHLPLGHHRFQCLVAQGGVSAVVAPQELSPRTLQVHQLDFSAIGVQQVQRLVSGPLPDVRCVPNKRGFAAQQPLRLVDRAMRGRSFVLSVFKALSLVS